MQPSSGAEIEVSQNELDAQVVRETAKPLAVLRTFLLAHSALEAFFVLQVELLVSFWFEA